MIRNIWAVGRNYSEHAKELGNPVPAAPMIFLKAGSSASEASPTLTIPSWMNEVHHEVELALRFDARLEIREACVALDLTDRAKQVELKSRGEPWTLAKTFSGACPLSKFFPVASLQELADLELTLDVNGRRAQYGRSSQMIFTIPALLDFVRSRFPVCPGDLLLTGTPAGVGPLKRGDRVRAEIVGRTSHEWSCV
jgi:2-keto-4-pentenoate hydratase/2-oxohepta-3-ene-1,7-dioic acid hydratase in catechol pathway